jgi:hypothetical protein
VVRGTGALGPIDAIEATPFGPLHPQGDGGDADPELPSDGAQRLARANGGLPSPDDAPLDALLAHGITS